MLIQVLQSRGAAFFLEGVGLLNGNFGSPVLTSVDCTDLADDGYIDIANTRGVGWAVLLQ
jgi:hypothetical protein